MARHYVKRLSDIVGEALPQFVSPDKLDRDTFVLPRFDKEKCIGCGRCYISCYDGGHQAIKFDPDTCKPSILGKRCVGCHLCMLICPVSAISAGVRIPKP